MRARSAAAAVTALLACVVLGSPAVGSAQAGDDRLPRAISRSRTRTLQQRDPAETQLGFGLLVERHLRYKAGGLARLPTAPGAADPVPGVYVTVTPGEALLFDRTVAKLDRGVFAPAALGGCVDAGRPGSVPRPVHCVPALRAAATRALAEEAARLRDHGVTDAPAALLFADQTVPVPTFLAAAYSVALGTGGAPPPLHLAVRSGGRLATIPIFLLPPRVVHLDRGLTPLILVVRVAEDRISLETSSHYSSGRRTSVANLAALERMAGELRARDPDRSVAFVTADGHTSVGELVSVMAALRVHYPNIVLGETGPGFAESRRRHGRSRE